MHRTNRWLRIALAAAVLPLGACGDVLEVESPGRILDSDLNKKDAIPGLVVGMSYDLASAYDAILEFSSLASGELYHGGSYDWGDVPRGDILPEDVNGEWASMHQARWVAEQGIERMRQPELYTEEEFNRSAYVARAYLLAGFANRLLGETVCQAVIDGGTPATDNMPHFERASDQFTQAIAIGEQAEAEDIVTAAYGGRASVRAWLGDWAGAVADAQMVPADFVYAALFATESPDLELYFETYDRYEYSVYNTEFAEGDPDDPRAPWEIVYKEDGSVETGANGATPMYQQKKYQDYGADVPLVKGTEMLVLRAEAALRLSNDIAGAKALLDEARDFYDLDPLDPLADLGAAWDALHYERGVTVWLEGRRFWDLRRWYAESGPAHHPFMEDRDACMPISETESEVNREIPG